MKLVIVLILNNFIDQNKLSTVLGGTCKDDLFSIPGKFQKDFEESIKRKNNKVYNHEYARIYFYDNKEISQIEEEKKEEIIKEKIEEKIEGDHSKEYTNELNSNNKFNIIKQ